MELDYTKREFDEKFKDIGERFDSQDEQLHEIKLSVNGTGRLIEGKFYTINGNLYTNNLTVTNEINSEKIVCSSISGGDLVISHNNIYCGDSSSKITGNLFAKKIIFDISSLSDPYVNDPVLHIRFKDIDPDLLRLFPDRRIPITFKDLINIRGSIYPIQDQLNAITNNNT